MKKLLIAIAALSLGAVAFAQDKKAEPTMTQKIEKAGDENVKATNKAKADKAAAPKEEPKK